MNSKIIYEIYQTLRNDNLTFIYHGEFSENLTVKLIDLSQYNIDNILDQSKLKRRVAFLIAESFQNIIKHHEDRPIITTGYTNIYGIFLIKNVGKTYYIASANLMSNEQIEELKSKLSDVNSLDEKQLKQLYLNILSTGENSGKSQAGLGLIEMARKSGQKLEYDFESVNDKLSFFYLQIELKSKNYPEEPANTKRAHLNIAKEFHSKMSKENINMIYKGDFSQTSITPILKIIKDSMKKHPEEINVKKRIYAIMVETLQNISHHSKVRNGLPEGILILGKNNKQYIVTVGNMLDNEQIKPLKNHLEKINNLKKPELEELYKTVLAKKFNKADVGSGVGLIDIARKSREKLIYDFVPVDEKTSFLTLIVKISS